MTRPSRQVRRAQAREANKRAKKSSAPVERPTNQHGFAVDNVRDRVIATFYVGEATFTVDYDASDARHIGEMLVQAADNKRANTQAPEIVSGSGLVIAHEIPESRT